MHFSINILLVKMTLFFHNIFLNQYHIDIIENTSFKALHNVYNVVLLYNHSPNIKIKQPFVFCYSTKTIQKHFGL